VPRHRTHGDPRRFEAVAAYVADRYWDRVRYIADVAGGQGLLARLLAKHYNYECEVIDPRGWTLKGVASAAREFDPAMAPYYDLIIGLHPDQALRAVAQAALARPALLVPCCNYWSAEKLGQQELLQAIEAYYRANGLRFERVVLPFKGPHNIALVSDPA
jgi:hypothetical protein